jgi:hypothetical protein
MFVFALFIFVSFYRFWSGTAPSMNETVEHPKTEHKPLL